MKDMPWFPFFARDWMTSRSRKRMPLEARGLYIDMLAHLWEGGPLPTEPEELAMILDVEVMVIHRNWPHLSPCFERTPAGLVNDKLERVRDEQRSKHSRRVAAATKAAKSRWER